MFMLERGERFPVRGCADAFDRLGGGASGVMIRDDRPGGLLIVSSRSIADGSRALDGLADRE